MRPPRRTTIHAATMDCLNCGRSTDFSTSAVVEVTLEAYLDKRRVKKLMRVIELDSGGYSRKWAGIFLSHTDTEGKRTIIRDDGKGHPSINCEHCGKVNVFGLEQRGDEPADGIIQVLGRSEADLRYLKEIENGNHGQGYYRVVRKEHPPEAGVAGGSQSPLRGQGDGPEEI